jgi:citronellol/citronellal dehydrogenase
MTSTPTLSGKTLFISGASRGIGLAIGLRAARDGANVVIAAKTTEPHPKLPGTIYTAAAEIEAAGGKALPLMVDIREESQVLAAAARTIETFGGIDILVNNASAISLTGTLHTPMKRYDLMHHINTRGTYLCSQACLPALLKAKNPHILNLSPPLNMSPHWFKNHVAYTMAKYGMSMCVLGMSAEFADEGVGVNALWPRTAIATAAINMIGGEAMMAGCRTVEIMADAAHVILTRDSRACTGNFFLDEDLLREVGVTEFDKYAVTPGATLIPDFFLD